MDNFIEIPFTKENLDLYYIRKSIFSAIKENKHLFRGRFLDLGCGKMPYKTYILNNSNIVDYIGLDIENSLDYQGEKPDYTWDGKIMPFDDDSFNTIFSTEVFEHVPNLNLTLTEIYRVLKKDGILFFTVPYLWTLHEVPHDECRYTPFALERLFKNLGFRDINIKALGGWNASLAQMIGLWVRRKPITKKKRRWISFILKPVIKYLIKKDIKPTIFNEGTMITGLYGIVKK